MESYKVIVYDNVFFPAPPKRIEIILQASDEIVNVKQKKVFFAV